MNNTLSNVIVEKLTYPQQAADVAEDRLWLFLLATEPEQADRAASAEDPERWDSCS